MWPRGFKSRTPRHYNAPRDFHQEIYDTIQGMKDDQLAELTIFHTVKKLKMMARSTDLNNPDKVKRYLAEKEGKKSYIEALALCYTRYARYNGIEWKPPKIIRDSQPPYVPTTEELTTLIANAGTKYVLILSLIKDGGFRPIELERMKRSWFNESKDSIRVATAKHGRGRLLKLKPSTADMLRKHIDANKFRLDENIFALSKTMRRTYSSMRKRTAEKLQQPTLNKVSLYSIRHYFASKLYQKTKSIVEVQRALGHKRIQQTLTYIHTITDGFEDEDFITAVAKTPEEACQLIENGFEKADEFDGIHIYKKRK
jgi:integrase